VPCAQFYNQEPSPDPEELVNVIRWVRPGGDFTANFPIFSRGEVNGEKRLPLYGWVTSRCESPIASYQDPKYLFYSPISKEDIRWNWEKILFDQSGQPYRRYASSVEPSDIEDDINRLLSGEKE